MKRFVTQHFLISVLTLILFSCTSREPKYEYKYNNNPAFTWGYAEFYGAYYANFNNSNHVITLSLFSDSLYINDEGNLAGIGQYLFIEDVFMSATDTILPDGTYKTDTLGAPFTFYPGEEFVVDDSKFNVGAYIYFIEKKSAFSTIKYVTRGSFDVKTTGPKQKITCNFVMSDSSVVKGTFNAELPHINQSVTTPAGIARKRLKLFNEIHSN
jgi:hypothetical protein